MPNRSPSAAELKHPRAHAAMRPVKLLVGAYVGLSVLTLVVAAVLHGDPAEVNDAVWVRGGILAAVSVLTYAFAVRAARGSRPAFLRLRIVTAVQVVAIVAILAIPGPFPLWMKIEQGVCGLVLIGVVVLVNGRYLRSLFADEE